MLIFATKNEGTLYVYQDLMHSNPLVEIGYYRLPDNDDARESSAWIGALKLLEELNMVYCINYNQKIYKLTEEGWETAEIFVKENELNESELDNPHLILEALN